MKTHKTKLTHKTIPFEIKANLSEGEFSGYGAVFNNLDEQGDIITSGAFKEDLPEFLASGFIGGLNHDWDNPVGAPLEAREEGLGLFIRGSIVDTSHGLDVRKLVQKRDPRPVITKLSIGFMVKGREYLESTEAVQAHWSKVGYSPTSDDLARSQYGARLLTRVKLFEVSPVAVPANARAVITAAKSESAPGRRTLADHSAAVLDELGEFRDRVKSFRDLTQKEGRELSSANRSRLKQNLDMLDQIRSDLAAILEATEPQKSVDPQSLFLGFVETANRIGSILQA